MAGQTGRPKIITEAMVDRAEWYFSEGWRECGDAVPTVAGCSIEIGVNRDTCYDWERKGSDPDCECPLTVRFSDILTRGRSIQERNLINGGLSQVFNPAVTKMMLTKHGYSDKVEQDNTHSGPNGGPIKTENTWIVQPVRPVNEPDA